MYEPHHHGVLGTNLMQNFPFTLSETSVRVERPAPLVAQHNREVLGGLLGIPDDEIKAGQQEGLFWPSSLTMPDYVENAFDAPARPRAALPRPSVVEHRENRYAD